MAPKTKLNALAESRKGITSERSLTPSKEDISSKSPKNSTPSSTSRRRTRNSPGDESESSALKPSSTASPVSSQRSKSTAKSERKKGKNPVDKNSSIDAVANSPENPTHHTKSESSKKNSQGKAKDLSNSESHLNAVATPQPQMTHKVSKTSKSGSRNRNRESGDTVMMANSSTVNKNEATKIKLAEENIPLAKPAPVMDVVVHRLRNFDYHPQPILCIASIVVDAVSISHDEVSMKEVVLPDSFIAVSREAGSIELQTIHPKWRTVSVIAGRRDTPMTSLAWVMTTVNLSSSISDDMSSVLLKQQALVGVHRNDLYIADFWGTGQLVSKYMCPGGSIFCIQTLHKNVIATGSQDGSIRIYSVIAHCSISESGKNCISFQFQPVSAIPSSGEAVLSLASMVPSGTFDSLKGTVLFAGIADGTIRRYDCYQSNVKNSDSTPLDASQFSYASGILWKSTLRMTMECYGRAVPTRVWAMKALSDGTLVSGDSLGHVQFWDGNTGTLLCSFDHNDNKADVLALDVASDECKVFASGVDSRVVCIERRSFVEASATKNTSCNWIMTHAQRPHTHDVKAISILKKFKISQNGKMLKETEIMYTGGIDTKVCTYHVSEFGLRRPRVLYPWPSLRNPILMANKARLLTMLRDDCVDLYELAVTPKIPEDIGAPIVPPELETLIGTIQVKGASNLSLSAISTCGKYLAVCDTFLVFLFHVRIETLKGGRKNVAASNVSIQIPKTCSIVAMQFIPEDCIALVFSDDSIRIFTIKKQDGRFETTMTQVLQHVEKTTLPQVPLFPMHSVGASTDGSWIATARNKCHHKDGNIDIYRRTSSGFQFWWSLPSLISAVTASVFMDDGGIPLMSVACIDFSWYIFDILNRSLSDWSMQAGYPLSANKLPAELATRNDFPIRIGSNPASPSLLLIVRLLCVCMTVAGIILPCVRL